MTGIDLYGTLQAQQTLEAELLLSASTGATDNYEQLKNRPSINGVVLSGDKLSEDLYLASDSDLKTEATARENADNELLQKIENTALTAQAQGASFTLTDASNNCGLYSLIVEGNSSKNGIPTPDNPIEIDSIGDSGSFTVTTDNGGEISTTATITSALPLCSVGDVKDELIFNANGTAKVIKRLQKLVLTGSESWVIQNNFFRCLVGDISKILNDTHFLSTVGSAKYTVIDSGGYGLAVAYGIRIRLENMNPDNNTVDELRAYLADNPITVIEPLVAEEEINLTADETADLLSLETFEGLTNVFNSDNAQMSVEYWRNQALGSLLTSISRSTNSRLTALENAIIGG